MSSFGVTYTTHDCSDLLVRNAVVRNAVVRSAVVRNAVVRNAVGRKVGNHFYLVANIVT